MASDLQWTNRALKEYENLVFYLYSEWGGDIAEIVIKDIDRTLLRIKNSPEQFPVIKKTKKIQQCVFSPQTSIYFRKNKNAIEILSVFDNRQNPQKLKL